MGFWKDNIGSLWEVEDKGKYSVARISVDKKDKDTGEWKQDFSGYVTLIGQAHDKAKTIKLQDHKNVKIRFGNGDVTTNYSREKRVLYTNYKLFSFNTVEWDSESRRWVNTDEDPDKNDEDDFMKVPDTSDDELPFNDI